MSFFDEFGEEGAIDAPRSAATAPQRSPLAARTGTLIRLLRYSAHPPLRSVPWTGTGLKEIGNRSKGRVKEKWGKLTDDDLDVINGRRDQLEGKIQERYGIAKDQTRRDIDDWYSVQKW